MRQPRYSLLLSCLGAVLTMILVLSPATVATAARFWKNSVVTGSWSNGNNWSATSAAGADNAGAPVLNDTVNIRPTDGASHLITYDVNAPSLTQLIVDLTGAVATTSTFSMSANNLTSSNEYIGYVGSGTFNHSGGTNTIAAGSGFLDVGVFAGSTGTYNLSGTGTLVANTNEYVGDVGTGVFNQTGGSNTISGNGHDLYLGYNSVGASGAYTLSAGSLTVSVGAEWIGYKVPGAFTQSGGTNTAQAVLVGSTSTGSYDLSGTGVLTTTGAGLFVGPGIFNQTGGTNNNINSALWVGEVSTGTYNLSGGSLSAGTEYLGHYGTAVFNHTGGTNFTYELQIGISGSGTIYTLSDSGLLSVDGNVHVGYSDVGTLNQTGGTLHGTDSLYVGKYGAGTYSLNGGSATVDQTVFVGSEAGGGNGTLNVSGTGILTIKGTFDIANTAGTAVNLSGGTINAAALDFGGLPALLNWTGGTLNVTSNVVWDSGAAATSTSAAFGAARTLGNNQTLMVTGNESLGGAGVFALTLDSGGTHSVTGTMTIATNGTLTQNTGSTLAVPTIIQSGGTVNGTLQNQTTFTYQAGLFNGRLVNHGTVNFASSFTVGNGIENHSSMIAAAGQTLTANGAGLDNQGLFTVASGGNLIATSVANQSEFVVNGSATSSTFTNSSLLRGTGQVTAAVTNAASGDVRVVAGERLRFAGASFTNQGLVEAIGNTTSPAEIEFSSPVTNASSTGLITGRNNVLRFNGGVTNQGSLAISIGTSDVFGDINNAATGAIVVSGGAAVTFYDDIVQNGTFRVSKVGSTMSMAVVFGAFSGSGGSTGGGDIFFEGDLRPGNSPASVTFGNNVAVGGGASINIELAGAIPGSQYDQIHVTGELALDGVLKVSLVNFNPLSGQSFDILDWGSLSGTFAALQLPTLAGGLMWNTSQLYSAGVLSVGLPGDFNFNGVVDAADYVVWRKSNGSQTDYDTWRAHYGAPPGSGSGSAGASPAQATVPEPATLVLLMFAAVGLCFRRAGIR